MCHRFLDGEELTGDNIETLAAYEDPVTHLETSSSVLSISDPGESYNGKQYKCTADMSALQMSDLHKIFNLSVQSMCQNSLVKMIPFSHMVFGLVGPL